MSALKRKRRGREKNSLSVTLKEGYRGLKTTLGKDLPN